MSKQLLVNSFQRIYGILLLFFGLNKIFSFINLPEKQGFAREFLSVLDQAEYLIPTIVIIQLISGICLVINRYVEVSLLILLPVSFNIFMFHFLHDFATLLPALVIAGANIAIILQRRANYNLLFTKSGGANE